MTKRIAVISDTHCLDWESVNPDMKVAIQNADIAIHCGDIVRQSVIDGFLNDSKEAHIVHGNSDPVEIRTALPYTKTIDVEGVKIGITHPAWGGPEFPPEELFNDFEVKPDIILFGHTHVPLNEYINGTLFVNPGQGYKSFMVDGTMAFLIIDQGKIQSEIKTMVKGKLKTDH
jgi:putative phosphoesterase